MSRWWAPGAALVLVVALASCGSLGYYAQAVHGHLDVMRQTTPIERLIAEPGTDPALRRKLDSVREIREFASRQLGLPDNGSYRGYADLGRPFVVWNVFAAAEFSTDPKQWCMWVVGCVSYRGYYAREDAERLAQQLRQEGYDAYVGGVPAYSTLGWFDDPVLNTFLRYGEPEVARVMFHELAHQVVFVADDTEFNESFATAVENEGMRRWLEARASPLQGELYREMRQRRQQFAGLVQDYRERLRELYGRDLPDAEKRRQKAETFAAMRRDYEAMKAGWNGYAGYDTWFANALNNAQLASVSLYTQLVPAFERLLDREARDLPRFYARAGELSRLPRTQRIAALDAAGADALGAAEPVPGKPEHSAGRSPAASAPPPADD